MIDWRANRLVDILAKMGANKFAPSDSVQTIITSMTSLTRHFAAQLGQTTYVANNFKREVIQDDGSIVAKFDRDSTPKPKCINVPAPRPPPLNRGNPNTLA